MEDLPITSNLFKFTQALCIYALSKKHQIGFLNVSDAWVFKNAALLHFIGGRYNLELFEAFKLSFGTKEIEGPFWTLGLLHFLRHKSAIILLRSDFITFRLFYVYRCNLPYISWGDIVQLQYLENLSQIQLNEAPIKDVFVSCAFEDREFFFKQILLVLESRSWLLDTVDIKEYGMVEKDHQQGLSVSADFNDPSPLMTRMSWSRIKDLENSRVVLAIISSTRDQECQMERCMALKLKKTIVPIMRGSCSVPCDISILKCLHFPQTNGSEDVKAFYKLMLRSLCSAIKKDNQEKEELKIIPNVFPQGIEKDHNQNSSIQHPIHDKITTNEHKRLNSIQMIHNEEDEDRSIISIGKKEMENEVYTEENIEKENCTYFENEIDDGDDEICLEEDGLIDRDISPRQRGAKVLMPVEQVRNLKYFFCPEESGSVEDTLYLGDEEDIDEYLLTSGEREL